MLMGISVRRLEKPPKTGTVFLEKFSLRECNYLGEKLLNLCAANDLFLENTYFKQSNTSRPQMESVATKLTTVLSAEKMKSSLTNARSFPSADAGKTENYNWTRRKGMECSKSI